MNTSNIAAAKQLRQFRETSQAFPTEARKDCAWEYHRLCRRDPFLLELLLAGERPLRNVKQFLACARKMRKQGWKPDR